MSSGLFTFRATRGEPAMGIIVNRLLQTGAALIILLASPVMAADMPVKTSLPPPAAPAFSWTGVYFGLNAGWLEANNSMVNQATPGVDSFVDVGDLAALATLATGDFSLGSKSGFIGGAEIGYNYQFNNWVAGIEADIQGIAGQAVNSSITSSPGTLSSTLNGSMDTKWLGTLRGRLGFLAAPTLLVYGTGGLAYSEIHASTQLSQSDSLTTDPSFPAPFTGSGSGGQGFSELVTGWTAGAGVEWMFTQNWSVKVEYLHYDLGTSSFSWVAQDTTTDTSTTPPTPGPNNGFIYQNETTSIHNQGNILRVGLNCFW
jgi:outer membrane immunogenic protein